MPPVGRRGSLHSVGGRGTLGLSEFANELGQGWLTPASLCALHEIISDWFRVIIRFGFSQTLYDVEKKFIGLDTSPQLSAGKKVRNDVSHCCTEIFKC